MLIVMKSDASRDDVDAVKKHIREMGFVPNEIPGPTRVAIGITGNEGPIDPAPLRPPRGIAEGVPISRPWKLVSREVKPDDTVVKIDNGASVLPQIGGGR